MCIFIFLPDTLLMELFGLWFGQDDVMKFDSAICNSQLRSNFLDLCSHKTFTFRQQLFSHSNNSVVASNNWLIWSFTRGFQVDKMVFDDLSWTKLKQVSIFHYSNLTLEDVNRIFNLHKGIQEVRCGSCNLISADKIVSFKRVKDSNELSVKFIISNGQKLRSAWFWWLLLLNSNRL